LDNFGEGDTYVDSGLVTYTVVDSFSNADSICWNMHTNWIRQLHYYKNYPPIFDTTYDNIDSGTFELWETKSGNHQLLVDSTIISNPIWKFYPSEIDSLRIYRYYRFDSSNDISVTTKSYLFNFKRDSGLTAMSYFVNGPCGHCASSTHANIVREILTNVNELGYLGDQNLQPHLYPNYPNPFNSETTIHYTLPQSTFVSIIIYNILGNEVHRISEHVQIAGEKIVNFDASRLPSGIYFYRLRAGNYQETRKLVLLK
jgi:hypothetical protein